MREIIVKPIYERLIGCPDEGFIVKEIRGEACTCAWHCHTEIELVYVLQSQGYRIVGDNIQSLQQGDMVLLGPNLPHAYQHTDRHATNQTTPHCILLQFEERIWSSLFELSALAPVRRLLQRAANGLHFTRPHVQTSRRVALANAEGTRPCVELKFFLPCLTPWPNRAVAG